MTHQAKRPYAGSQPHITSYFPQSTTSTIPQQYNITASPLTYTSTSSSNIPVLPPHVQSNLIQVGMRVRKSVPEGYKTGTYSAFSLFSDTTSHPQSAPTPNPAPTHIQPKTRPRAGARELTPFCGILKVGGMSQQQWGIYSAGSNGGREDPYLREEEFADGENEEMDDGDGVPFLSSQGSTISSSSVDLGAPVGNKRRFFEDEEEEEVAGEGAGIWRGGGLGERVLAVPRRKKWVGHGKGVNGGGQENVGILGQDVDFEEADFLDYRLVEEVEMGGCN